MNEVLTIPTGNALTALLHSNSAIPEPFTKPVYLTSTYVAGSFYVENIRKLAATLSAGERLKLMREPKNQYDEFAVLIQTNQGEKLGYLPKRMNKVPARLMDAGKCLYGEFKALDTDYGRCELRIGIYMQD